MDEKVGEKTEFDSAPFDMLDKVSHAQQHTVTATMEYRLDDLPGGVAIMEVTEVLDGDNAYAGDSSNFDGDTSTTAYLRIDGKSYFVDFDLKVYYEDEVPYSVDDVIYMSDFAGLSDMLKDAADTASYTDVSKVTIDGEEYVRYTFVIYEENYYFYAKNGIPAILAVIEEGVSIWVTFDKLETTADTELLKIPDGFSQITEDEYYDM